jgi:hypothetical protein
MSDTLEDRIDQKSAAAGEAWQAGDLAQAETLLLKAWDEVGAETDGTDLHQQLSGNIVLFFQKTEQFDKAYAWLETMRGYYDEGGKPNPHTDLIRATLDYDSGDHDRAFDGFAALYKKFGKRPFAGEDPKYLGFYESRR